MSTALIPFESAGVPAYARSAAMPDINKDVFQAAQFNTLSIEGKRFTAKKDGVKKVLMKPKAHPSDDDEVAQNIGVVVLRANMKTKVYYAKKFVSGQSDNTPPTCYSMDGIAPSPMASEKQSARCATCKHNVWGSRINDDGEAKGRACADFARLAVATPDALDEPYLLRVPPASLRPFRDAVKKINERQVDYNVVVMRVGFDITASSPKLTFKPIALLGQDECEDARAQYDTEVVRAIVGADDHGDESRDADPQPAEQDEEDAAFDAAVAAHKAEAAPAPAPATASKPSRSRAAKPPAAPTAEEPAPPAQEAPAAVAVSSDLMDDLDALLGSSDD